MKKLINPYDLDINVFKKYTYQKNIKLDSGKEVTLCIPCALQFESIEGIVVYIFPDGDEEVKNWISRKSFFYLCIDKNGEYKFCTYFGRKAEDDIMFCIRNFYKTDYNNMKIVEDFVDKNKQLFEQVREMHHRDAKLKLRKDLIKDQVAENLIKEGIIYDQE
jgi:hypothetical protein